MDKTWNWLQRSLQCNNIHDQPMWLKKNLVIFRLINQGTLTFVMTGLNALSIILWVLQFKNNGCWMIYLCHKHCLVPQNLSFGTPLFKRYLNPGDTKFGLRKMFTQSLYLLCLLKGHYLFSGERDTFSGSWNLDLTSIQGKPYSNQTVTDHKSRW